MSELDGAILRGWARGRPAIIVVGDAAASEAIENFGPTTLVEGLDGDAFAEQLSALPAGALIVNAGRGRVAIMRQILDHAPHPVTVLWRGYVKNFGVHRIEKRAIPTRTINNWAVFEVPAAQRSSDITR